MDHDHGAMTGNSTSGSDMPGMAMYFVANKQFYVLFKEWQVNGDGKFAGALIGVFFLAFFYEALKYFRESLYEQTANPLLDNTSRSLLGGMRKNIVKTRHLIQTLLHMIQLVLSYFLMLIFMTYNVWLAIAITSGAGMGYLLFGWNKRTATDLTEHCH